MIANSRLLYGVSGTLTLSLPLRGTAAMYVEHLFTIQKTLIHLLFVAGGWQCAEFTAVDGEATSL